MAVFKGLNAYPNYIATTSEMDENDMIEGVSNIASTVFMTDNGTWYIVSEDTSLVPFYAPTTPPA